VILHFFRERYSVSDSQEVHSRSWTA